MAFVKLQRTRTREIDKMFAKIQFSLSKDGKRCIANFILGNDLAQMISDKEVPNKIDIFYDETNPYLVVIRKAENENDCFKIRKSKNGYQLSISWKFKYPETENLRSIPKVEFNLN